MEPIIEGQISSAEEKMTSYLLLLSYRYMNLCVKAEMGALMPVSILTTTGPKDLENVADVGLPNEYQFAIIPKSPSRLTSCRILSMASSMPTRSSKWKSRRDR